MNRLDLRYIVCPVDLSQASRFPLALGMAIARAHTAELRAIYVVPSAAAMPDGGFLRRESITRQLRQSLTEADPNHALIGTAVRHGDPGTQILDVARVLDADVIVIGAPVADRPERPMGPVASVVIARSACPVLTVPASDRMGE